MLKTNLCVAQSSAQKASVFVITCQSCRVLPLLTSPVATNTAEEHRRQTGLLFGPTRRQVLLQMNVFLCHVSGHMAEHLLSLSLPPHL